MQPNEATAKLCYEWLRSAEESLSDAEFLLLQQRSVRSILNRAYFAVFYAMRAMLLANGVDELRPKAAILEFDRHIGNGGWVDESLSRIVHDTFELRLENDYRLIIPSSPKIARTLVSDAGTFVFEARDYLAGVLPS